jgi:formylglycine-generating enzyme required for sulfatase activity
MTDQTNRPLRVFLCHAHSDAEQVRALYSRLQNDGVAAWLDKEDIIPGQDWDYAIRKAVRESDIVIVCLSKQFNQKGYRQNEVRVALEEANLQPAGEIFVIPARLEECDYPDSLRRFHGVDLYEERGYEYLMRALRLRADKIGAVLQSKKGWLGSFTAPAMKPASAKKPKPAPKKFAPAPSVNPKPAEERIENKKLSIQVVIAIVGAVATILAAVLANLPWDKWFASAPQTETPYVTAAAIFPTETLPPPTETQLPPTNTPEPPTFTPTPTLGIGSSTESGGVTMMYVPAGEFTMGSGDAVHSVTLDAYWIDKFEVTNAAYKKCVDAGVCDPPKESKSYTRTAYYSNPEFDEYPVIYVDWTMATTYCEWRDDSLPTEAQWEKAARGTDGRTYPWGENINCDKANYHDGNKYCVGDTTKVGSYESGKSPYEVYDMAGNVWEWVNDWYDGAYYQSSPASNPLGPSSGTYRVLRGGSWNNFVDYNVRSASRYYGTPDYISVNVGFRCARSLP